MKKETSNLIESWFFVGWFAFAIISAIKTYFSYGWGIDLQFILIVFFVCGIPMTYFLLKSVKKKEFRLRKPLKIEGEKE